MRLDEVFRSIVAARRGQKPDEIQTRLAKNIATLLWPTKQLKTSTKPLDTQQRLVSTFSSGRKAACAWKSPRRLLRCGNSNLWHLEIYLPHMSGMNFRADFPLAKSVCLHKMATSACFCNVGSLTDERALVQTDVWTLTVGHEVGRRKVRRRVLRACLARERLLS